jgi:glycosyltransferase involved in cell wall biosynthesis
VRVLIDYRAALKSRSGVGEYTHGLVTALAGRFQTSGDRQLDLTIFSSSWRDRLTVASELRGLRAIDRRIPVSGLNLAWHRFGWPPAETIAGADFDITHSMHPLLMPSRRAAQVVTIHDLNFLTHPERTRAEIRRDYPRLARSHAHQADRVIVVSRFTASEVASKLEVPESRISVCSPGAPSWTRRARVPADGYVLFLGTLEPRKNVGTLLEAYSRLASGWRSERPLPELVLAGQAPPESAALLDRLRQPPLAGHARHIGYVPPDQRRTLYEGARLLVQPSFEEGFGLPVLEAMTVGVPVVAAARGALPEVLGDAGLLVDPHDSAQMASAMTSALDEDFAAACVTRGFSQAGRYRWSNAADHVYEAYQLAIEERTRRVGDQRCASV